MERKGERERKCVYVDEVFADSQVKFVHASGLLLAFVVECSALFSPMTARDKRYSDRGPMSLFCLLFRDLPVRLFLPLCSFLSHSHSHKHTQTNTLITHSFPSHRLIPSPPPTSIYPSFPIE